MRKIFRNQDLVASIPKMALVQSSTIVTELMFIDIRYLIGKWKYRTNRGG